jgi:hypothetical protein
MKLISAILGLTLMGSVALAAEVPQLPPYDPDAPSADVFCNYIAENAGRVMYHVKNPNTGYENTINAINHNMIVPHVVSKEVYEYFMVLAAYLNETLEKPSTVEQAAAFSQLIKLQCMQQHGSSMQKPGVKAQFDI